MKKIIIFNSGSFVYGAERGLLNLIKTLKSGFDITVVIPRKGPLADKIKEVNPSVNIIVFPLAVLMFSLSPFYFVKFIFLFFIDFFFFLFYINHNDIEIVSTNSSLLPFPALCASLLNKPHIWHIREIFPYKLMNYFFGRYIKVFSSQIICQSKFIREKFYLENGANVVYESLDKKDYNIYEYGEARRILKLPLRATVISLISRIHPAKGQYEFLVSLKRLLRKNRNIIVLIAGDTGILTLRTRVYKRKIEEFIKEHKLRNVIISGFIDDIGLVLSATDVCVFPFKREEPFGIAVAEALSFGIDTFYPFSGGLKEVYEISKKGKDFRIDEVIKVIKEYRNYKKETTVFNVPDQFLLAHYKNIIVKIYANAA